MPILFVLMVAAVCLPVPWPPSPLGLSPVESAVATAGLMAVPLAAAAGLSAWTARALRTDPLYRPVVLARYVRLRRWLGRANLLAAAVAVGPAGWGWTVWHTVTADMGGPRPVLVPGGEWLVPAPYFLAVVLGWVVYYPAERRLFLTSAEAMAGRLAAGGQAYWSLPGYVLFHARQFVLLVFLPVGLFTGPQVVARVAPDVAASEWFQLGALAAVGVLFVFLPRAVKPLLGLTPLPAGPDRERMERFGRRLGFRYTDLLLWPTRGAVANAMVLGIVPWARYVVFTDRLLLGLDDDELDAVLGHEIGHVHHRHIVFYAIFLLLSAATVSLAGAAAVGLAVDAGAETWLADAGDWLHLPPLVGMGAYLFVVFGLLSRRCERQADVFGCRAGSCGDPACVGHDETTVLGPPGLPVCPTGARAMTRALDRVLALNGADDPRPARSRRRRLMGVLKAWQHGPIADRVEFLHRLADDPDLADRIDRRVRRFRWGLLAILVAAFAGLGSWIGWADVWRQL